MSIREKSAKIADTLATFEMKNAEFKSLDLRPLYTAGLATEEAVFVQTLKAMTKDATINQPNLEAVQRQEAFVEKMHV